MTAEVSAQRGGGVGNVRFGRFELDTFVRRLICVDDEIHLTPKCFDLLAVLAGSAPHVVRKAELHERLWADTVVSEAALVGLIKELRRAFRQHGASELIRTAHGVGYALDAVVEYHRLPPADVRHWLATEDHYLALRPGDNVVGRDASADIALGIPSVSRRHAVIRVGDSLATVEDLGSKNGTVVDGQLIEAQVVLTDGARIEFGTTAMTYRVSSPSSSTVSIHASPDGPRDQ